MENPNPNLGMLPCPEDASIFLIRKKTIMVISVKHVLGQFISISLETAIFIMNYNFKSLKLDDYF